MPSEEQFKDRAERDMAIACYLALITWMDENVGRIIDTLERCGLSDTTRVIYTSDHGDNIGHRGLWGKSNFYLESVAVPLIMAGPGIEPGVCETPVSLIDLYPTVLAALDVPVPADEAQRPGRSLFALANERTDHERLVFSQYHAVGSEMAGYMVRHGRWKYHHYVGYPPELFDLQDDPQELNDLGSDPGHQPVVKNMHEVLLSQCDPQAVDAAAKQRQAELIAYHGGREQALTVGAPAATPPPGETSA
ncbi:MAG: sulfatase-like hydrolase/transferase [Gammaproteobacteria bacterium]|nr:sulfatase-like hydrolase/transferase [Gammaproteobacteria bacterium]